MLYSAPCAKAGVPWGHAQAPKPGLVCECLGDGGQKSGEKEGSRQGGGCGCVSRALLSLWGGPGASGWHSEWPVVSICALGPEHCFPFL